MGSFLLNAREFVVAALRVDDLAVCQTIKDAARAGFSWTTAPPPDFASPSARAVYASLVELLAWRNGDDPPSWTAGIGPSPTRVYLVPSASRAMRRGTPRMLLKRNISALPDYLDLQPWLKGPRLQPAIDEAAAAMVR